jgi:hypothetical protein
MTINYEDSNFTLSPKLLKPNRVSVHTPQVEMGKNSVKNTNSNLNARNFGHITMKKKSLEIKRNFDKFSNFRASSPLASKMLTNKANAIRLPIKTSVSKEKS